MSNQRLEDYIGETEGSLGHTSKYKKTRNKTNPNSRTSLILKRNPYLRTSLLCEEEPE